MYHFLFFRNKLHYGDVESGIFEYKNNESNLDNENKRHSPFEIPVLGLVPENMHTQCCAETSSDQSHEKQSGFGYSPGVFASLGFVYTHNEKTYNIYCCCICRNQKNCFHKSPNNPVFPFSLVNIHPIKTVCKFDIMHKNEIICKINPIFVHISLDIMQKYVYTYS